MASETLGQGRDQARDCGLSDQDIDTLSYEELCRLASADMMLQRHEAQESPLGLYKLLFTDEASRPVVIKDFHYEWDEFFRLNRLCVVEAPRESTKSSFLMTYCAWLIGRNPNIRVKWLSCDLDTAIKRLSVIHALVDKPLYKAVFPEARKLTTKESRDEKRPNVASVLNLRRNITTPEHTVEACGILTSGVGGRADELLADDVVSENNALTNPTLRPKVISKFLSDWLGTLVAKGGVKYIGSPWHNADLLAYLKKNANWPFRRYQHGKPGNIYFSIFPERWPEEALRERRRTLGPLHYARAYNCLPLLDGTVAVSPESLRPYTEVQLTAEKLNTAIAVVCVDPSSGKQLQKGKLDYTGVTVLLVSTAPEQQEREQESGLYQEGSAQNAKHPGTAQPPKFEVFIPEAYQVRLPHIYQPKLIWQLVRQWQANYIVIEAEGMQSLHAWMEEQRQQDPGLPLAEIHPVSSGNRSKGQRLMEIVPLLHRPEGELPVVYFHPQVIDSSPQPFFIDVGGTPFEALRDLRDQLLGFPTEHDDIMDSTVHGLRWAHENLVSYETADGFFGGESGSTGATSAVSCISI